MAEASKPTFLVDASSDPVAVRIEGRASFQNSAADCNIQPVSPADKVLPNDKAVA